MTAIANDIGSNYDQLRRSRGWSWKQMADHVERQDPALAKWMREQKESADIQRPEDQVLPQKQVASELGESLVPDKTVGPFDRASLDQEIARLTQLRDDLPEEELAAEQNPGSVTPDGKDPAELESKPRGRGRATSRS